VIGVIAGGYAALTRSVEGAEDDADAGRQAMADLDVKECDSVVGIAASGRTPYVVAGLGEARRRGALTVALTCNLPARWSGTQTMSWRRWSGRRWLPAPRASRPEPLRN